MARDTDEWSVVGDDLIIDIFVVVVLDVGAGVQDVDDRTDGESVEKPVRVRRHESVVIDLDTACEPPDDGRIRLDQPPFSIFAQRVDRGRA